MAWAMVAGAAISVVGGAVSSRQNRKAAEKASEGANESMRIQNEIALDQWDRYKELYAPLEAQQVAEAQQFDSEANLERAASEASANVSSQFGKARDRLTRTPGMDPSSAAFANGLIGLDIQQAAVDATQQNLARRGVKDQAYARRQAAVAIGKGLDSTASGALGATARTQLGLADAAQQRAQQDAASWGQFTDRVVTPVLGQWLGTTKPVTPPPGG